MLICEEFDTTEEKQAYIKEMLEKNGMKGLPFKIVTVENTEQYFTLCGLDIPIHIDLAEKILPEIEHMNGREMKEFLDKKGFELQINERLQEVCDNDLWYHDPESVSLFDGRMGMVTIWQGDRIGVCEEVPEILPYMNPENRRQALPLSYTTKDNKVYRSGILYAICPDKIGALSLAHTLNGNVFTVRNTTVRTRNRDLWKCATKEEAVKLAKELNRL